MPLLSRRRSRQMRPVAQQQQHALLLLESALPGVNLARSSYATSSDAWPPMLHDRVPQRLSSRRQQAGACSFACLLASLGSYRPLARGCGAVDGSSGKLGRRRDVRALVRRSRTQPRWESPQRRRLCVSIRAAPLGRARRGASSSALLTRHAIGQRIPGSRFAGAAPSCRQRPTPSARWRRPSSSSHTCPPCVGRRPLSRSPRTKHQ